MRRATDLGSLLTFDSKIMSKSFRRYTASTSNSNHTTKNLTSTSQHDEPQQHRSNNINNPSTITVDNDSIRAAEESEESLPYSSSTSPSSSTPITTSAGLALLRGTKPWVGGSYLTSCGIRELDGIIGGGQPIGSCLLLEEDRYTDLCRILARYWAAEAVAQKQYLLLVQTKSDTELLPSTLPTLAAKQSEENLHNTAFHGASLADLQNFINKIPRDAHLDKYRAAAAASTISSESSVLGDDLSPSQAFEAIVEEEEEEEEEPDDQDYRAVDATASMKPERRKQEKYDDGEELLKIAWQYKLSIQNARYQKNVTTEEEVAAEIKKHSDIFCHSYDLSGRMRDQYPSELFDLNRRGGKLHVAPQHSTDDVNTTTTAMIGVVKVVSSILLGKQRKLRNDDDDDSDIQRISRGIQLFRSLVHRIEQEVGKQEGMVVRLLVLNAPPSEMSVALPLLLTTIRKKKLAVVVCITIRPFTSTGNTSTIALQRTSDFVFKVDGFESFRKPPPTEFRNLNGILHVQKITKSLNHFTTSKPATTAPRYGLLRDRRKLHLQMLHLPPEDFSSTGAAAAVRRTFGSSAVTPGGKITAAARDSNSLCGSTLIDSSASSTLDF